MKKRAMMSMSYFLLFSILINATGVLVPEITAALQPFCFLGEVTGINDGQNTITIDTEYTWNGEWTSSGESLTGEAPPDAVHELKVGDYVEAASLGAPGNTWVALGKMTSREQRIITDIYGDPAHLISDTMMGDYSVIYENEPDCDSCYGCNCDALYSDVTIKKNNSAVDTTRLAPGQAYAYRGEDYTVDIVFHSGQAWVYPTCGNEPCMGPQSVSNFTIQVSRKAGPCTSGVLLAMMAAILAIYWLTRRKKEA